MRDVMYAILGGAFRVADVLEDWIAETVRGYGAAAPFVSATAPSTVDAEAPTIR
jgi:hypothetical protein